MVSTKKRRVPQTRIYYWGEGGQYGPYDIQQEGPWAGWPNFGQVLYDFRTQMKPKLTAKAFGKLYGQKVNEDGSSISERRVYEMEANKVPIEIDRRKIITEILNIPPMLLGVAALEDVTLVTDPKTSRVIGEGQTILKRYKTDIEKYEADLRTRWKLLAIGDAGDALPAIDADVQQLEELAKEAKGKFLANVQQLLFSNSFLASAIVSRKRRLSDAYRYANHAVRIAKALDDPDLVATALYYRGSVRLVIGLYGTCNENGIFVMNRIWLEDAVRDFEDAKKEAHPQLKGRAMLEGGRAQAHLDMNYNPFNTTEQAARLVGKSNINDPYMRQLVTGTYSGFHDGSLLIGSALLLNASGDPREALKTIEDFKRLGKNTYSKDQRPTFAWIDIIAADSYLRTRNYDQATTLALQALEACLDLRDLCNIAIIRDLHGRLLGTSYRNNAKLEKLGEMLRTGKIIE